MKLRLTLISALIAMIPATTRAEPVKVGDPAPQVSGTTETGATLPFADVYNSHKYTLVYFFPKAETPGCTAQGCSLRDANTQLLKQGVAVLGVSADTVEAQKAFKEKFHFPFTLIADPEHKVAGAFGVPRIPLTSLDKRQAYLIEGGKVVWADYAAATDRQAEDVLHVIAARDGK